MKLPRRAFLHLAAGAAALPATVQPTCVAMRQCRTRRRTSGLPAW